MIIKDIIKYLLWWNRPINMKIAMDIEYVYTQENGFLLLPETFLDTMKYRGIKQFFTPMIIAILHYDMEKKERCHFWMGKMWCYCKADILEKLSNENNCPLSNRDIVEKLENKKFFTMQAYNKVVSKIRQGKV